MTNRDRLERLESMEERDKTRGTNHLGGIETPIFNGEEVRQIPGKEALEVLRSMPEDLLDAKWPEEAAQAPEPEPQGDGDPGGEKSDPEPTTTDPEPSTPEDGAPAPAEAPTETAETPAVETAQDLTAENEGQVAT